MRKVDNPVELIIPTIRNFVRKQLEDEFQPYDLSFALEFRIYPIWVIRNPSKENTIVR